MPRRKEPPTPETPEKIHKIIMTYPSDHFNVQKTQNLPYADKRILAMLHSLGITRYGMYDYELEIIDDSLDPFGRSFPTNCKRVARKIVTENKLKRNMIAPIARIIAAAYLDSGAAYRLIKELPKFAAV